jgi:hypothetical protein
VAAPPAPATPGRGAQPPAPPRRAPRQLAHLEIAQGVVESARGDGDEWTDVVAGSALAAGDRIRTLASRAKIAFEGGSLLFVDRYTTLTIDLDAERPGVAMVGGEVFADVSGRDVGFWVSTPQGRAVDLGTRFGITSKGGTTTVYVAEGEVEASTDAGAATVRTRQEVLLLRRTMPPGTVRRMTSLAARATWLDTLGGYALDRRLAFDLRMHETYGPAAVTVTAPDAVTLGGGPNVCILFGKPSWSSYILRSRVHIDRTGGGNYGVGLVALWNGPASSCRVRYFGRTTGEYKINTGFAATQNDVTRAKHAGSLRAGQAVNMAIEVHPVDGGTRIRARVWPPDAPEPEAWPLTTVVPEGLRASGRAGIWAFGCQAQFTALTVERLAAEAHPPKGGRR